jgi:hypothetical protein
LAAGGLAVGTDQHREQAAHLVNGTDPEEVTGSNPVAPAIKALTSGNAGRLAVWRVRWAVYRMGTTLQLTLRPKVDQPWIDQFKRE